MPDNVHYDEINAYDRIKAALANFTRYEESDIRQLESIGKRMMNGSMYGCGIIYAIAGSIREAKAVVDEPRRNCDVGTPEEQGERCLAQFNEWRRKSDGKKLITAIMAWAQMPYAEKGGAE